MPEFGSVSDADHAAIFVKLDSQYDNYTVAQMRGSVRNSVVHLKAYCVFAK